MSYFYPFGRCRHCSWPHHVRVDLAAKPKRPWRSVPQPAQSYVQCCNCGLRTAIKALEAQR